MSKLEKPDTGSASGHANGKALAALILGAFALANVVVLVIFLALSVETLDDSGGLWLLLPFFGLTAGLIAAFLGSIGWIDVRRGVTDRRLFEAQFGAILGGIAAGLILLAIVILMVFGMFLIVSFANEGVVVD
ncbi:MAG: hypothetical protein IT199_00170 [Solirubrobacterales bacterium]|nr:hypothetical protein [Solirubrobacterales bacterium]